MTTRKSIEKQTLSRNPFFSRSPLAVYLVFACTVFFHPLLLAELDHEYGTSGRAGRLGGPSEAAAGFGGRCNVSSQRMADFANGDSYDFPNMVSYLTNPACQSYAREISRAAVSSGVDFIREAPFKLDAYAKSITASNLESARNVDLALARTVPNLLRQQQLTSTELLPIVGQLALLSPQSGRMGMTKLIQQEVLVGDGRIQNSPQELRPQASAELAATLVKLGANTPLLANELAQSVDEMAVLAQADSLARFFRGLAAAATADESLGIAYQLSAGALNRGVQKGSKIFEKDDERKLTKAVFLSIQKATQGAGVLEAGAEEMNEAMETLLRGEALSETALRQFWRQVARVLVRSTTQTALAKAVALSLTPKVIFLEGKDRADLVATANNYPAVAVALQDRFAQAWKETWRRMNEREITLSAFNRIRNDYFLPLTGSILQFTPEVVDADWLKLALNNSLVSDDAIEKRFPRFVLGFLDRREKAAQNASANTSANVSVEPMLTAMGEDLAVLWALGNVHVPALGDWVEKYQAK